MKTWIQLAVALIAVAFAGCANTLSQAPPRMKMTTDIPRQITTPDSVGTRIGTLKFFDGFPDDATVVLFRRSLRLTQVHVDRTGHRNNIRQNIWLGTRLEKRW